jgi:hypothetical protein
VIGHCVWDPFDCAKNAAGSAVSATIPSAWNAVCKSFAEAAGQVLIAFGKAFAAFPDVRLGSAGITGTFGISLVVAGSVAALLMFGQVIRTVWSHDGSGLAHGIAGLGKAVLAWLLTAAVASASLAAADEVTRFTVDKTFGSQQALAVRLGGIVNWTEAAGVTGQAAVGGSLLLVIALVGIVLVIVLWFELLLRNAAIAVLIAVSPIAAAGQVSETTKAWWPRMVSAVVQLIILKPVIALVFAVGLGMAGTSSGIEPMLAGLLVLGLAVFAWPVIARFFTFAAIQASSSGLSAVLGFAAGRMSGGSGQPAGVDPSRWSLAAEQRTMSARGGYSGTAGGGGIAAGPGGAEALAGAAGTTGASPGAGGSGTGGGGSAVLAGIGWALGKATQAGSVLAGRMEQTAAHAGMHGAYPYSTVSGTQRLGPGGSRQRPPAAARTDAGPGQPPSAEPGTPAAVPAAPEPPLVAPPPPEAPGTPAETDDGSSEGDQG